MYIPEIDSDIEKNINFPDFINRMPIGVTHFIGCNIIKQGIGIKEYKKILSINPYEISTCREVQANWIRNRFIGNHKKTEKYIPIIMYRRSVGKTRNSTLLISKIKRMVINFEKEKLGVTDSFLKIEDISNCIKSNSLLLILLGPHWWCNPVMLSTALLLVKNTSNNIHNISFSSLSVSGLIKADEKIKLSKVERDSLKILENYEKIRKISLSELTEKFFPKDKIAENYCSRDFGYGILKFNKEFYAKIENMED